MSQLAAGKAGASFESSIQCFYDCYQVSHPGLGLLKTGSCLLSDYQRAIEDSEQQDMG